MLSQNSASSHRKDHTRICSNKLDLSKKTSFSHNMSTKVHGNRQAAHWMIKSKLFLSFAQQMKNLFHKKGARELSSLPSDDQTRTLPLLCATTLETKVDANMILEPQTSSSGSPRRTLQRTPSGHPED